MNNPQNGGTEVPVEVLQPSALHSLERAMIDTQVATAHQYPRSMEQFKKRAMGMATLDDETAESCMYSRPVGKEQNASGQWVQKFAEGASIRLAEIVAASYGNIRVASRIIEQTDRYVKVEGIAHDLESNYAAKSEVVEATVKQDGTPYSERQRNVVAKAALSKAFRDAIFKVVPKAMCKTVYDAAKGIALGKGKTMQQRIAKLQGWIKSLKVDDARVFGALGIQGWADIGESQLETLAGVYTAIKDGEVKIEDAFPEVAKKPGEFAGPGGAIPRNPPLQGSNVPVAPQTGQPAGSDKATPAAEKPAQGTKAAEPTPEKEKVQTSTPVSEKKGPKPTEKPPTGRANRPTMVEKEPEERPEASEADLGAAGLAPVAATEKAPFVPNPNENEQLQNIRFLCHEYNVTEEQLVRWCKSPEVKLLKENQQHIAEMASMKLANLGKLWGNSPKEFLAKIQAVNAAA